MPWFDIRGCVRLLITVSAVFVFLAAAPSGLCAKVFDPKTFTLANGLQVVVISNHRAPIAIQMVWYKIGAADEPAGKSGIAHFLEHLMFKGTKTVPPGEFSKIVARNGGQDNAFTSQDYTAYFQRVAKNRLELVMRLEADRMTGLTLSDREVLPERDVVLEERRSRTDNNPGAQLYEQSQAALYLHHPYGDPVIGWKSEIETLSTEDALAWYRKYYAPNNAILIIAGDVTVDEIKPLAEKYYGPIPSRAVPPRIRLREPPHLAARRVVLKSPQVRQPSWSRAFIAPSSNTAKNGEAAALQVLAEILGGGPTSRLYRALIVVGKIAASANAWYSANALDLGTFGLSASPRPGGKIKGLEAAMMAEINRLLADGVTEDEVARAKKALRAGAIYVRDSLRAGPNIIGRALTSGRSIADVESWPERIGAVTREQVDAAARAVLREKNSVTSVLLPDSAS
jgi:zinc protease